EQLDLGGGEREHQRERVVVPRVAVDHDRRRRHVSLGQSSMSAASGSDRCAPIVAAAYAPALQARCRASSYGRSSSRLTTRQAANASPAPVPSTGMIRGDADPATCFPSSNSTAPCSP